MDIFTQVNTVNSPKHHVAAGWRNMQRVDRNMMEHLKATIIERLRRNMRLATQDFGIVTSTPDRTSFGDLDVIVKKSVLKKGWEQSVSANVIGGNKGFYKVSGTNITIFALDNVQINFHEFDGDPQFAVGYLSQGKVGQILTEIAKNIGYEYDLTGLKVMTGIPKTPTVKVQITAAYLSRILGYSLENLTYYCSNLKSVFDLMKSSTYFNREVFLALEGQTEYLNERPILREFIQYLKGTAVGRSETKFVMSENAKSTLQHTLMSYHPAAITEVQKIILSSKRDDIIEAKYNDTLISEITTITGDMLKTFKESFEKSFKDGAKFELFVLSSLPSTISEALIKHRDETLKPEQYAPQPEVAATEVTQELKEEAPPLKVKPKAKPKAKTKAPDSAKPKRVRAKKVLVPVELPQALPPTVGDDYSFALAA